jgi:cytochrome c oxidase cbb3-type subunit 3
MRPLKNLTESLGTVFLLHAATAGLPPAVVIQQAVVAAAQAAPTTTATQPAASPAAQLPPATAVQVERGQRVFASQCGFCHGRDAMGGETGPDLTRSTLVRDDSSGNKIRQVVREGRVDKGMPALHVSDTDLTAAIAYIKSQRDKAELPGARRSVEDADLETGDAEAGRLYFNGPGRCARCHSPTGDFAGLTKRTSGLDLLRRMLYPKDGRGATVAVTLASGEKIEGALAYRDEFTIALTDASGRYRSWPTGQVKFTVNNPLEAHAEQLGHYSDEDMHNVLAYLRTLR